jgi:uncharacterized protein DUF4233
MTASEPDPAGENRPTADENRPAADDKPSGLRNPRASVRGVGAAALSVEALVLLLAIQPMRVLRVHLTGAAIGTIIGLAVLCILLAGMLNRNWAWYAGFVVQLALIVTGFIFHISLTIIGVLFLLLWIYVVSVRRTVLGKS